MRILVETPREIGKISSGTPDRTSNCAPSGTPGGINVEIPGKTFRRISRRTPTEVMLVEFLLKLFLEI